LREKGKKKKTPATPQPSNPATREAHHANCPSLSYRKKRKGIQPEEQELEELASSCHQEKRKGASSAHDLKRHHERIHLLISLQSSQEGREGSYTFFSTIGAQNCFYERATCT